VRESQKIIAVVSLKAIDRSQPHITTVILHNVVDEICREAIDRAEMRKRVLPGFL
jgi:hypothetical protein